MDIYDISRHIIGNHFVIEDVQETETEMNVFAKSLSRSCKCPCCGMVTSKPAGTYKRRPQDIPLGGKTTWLNLTARKYSCTNSECSLCSFSEPIDFIGRSAQRTDRLDTLILSTSIFLSSSSTNLVLGWNGIRVSHTAVQQLQARVQFPDESDLEHIGIDDFSTHKGNSYGTVAVSGKDHHVVMVVGGRDYNSAREALKNFPKLKFVNRDRDSAYAKAIRDTIEGCTQIADPFHLSDNLIDNFRDIFRDKIDPEFYFINDEILSEAPPKETVLRVDPQSKKLGELPYDNTPVSDGKGGELVITPEKKPDTSAAAGVLDRKIAKMEAITKIQKELAENGRINYTALANRLNISAPTVKTYSLMPQEKVDLLQGQIAEGLAQREIQTLRDPATYNPLIYKALYAREAPETIYSLCVRNGYTGTIAAMERQISGVGRMFNLNIQESGFATKSVLPDGVDRVKQGDILKYITIRDRSRMGNSAVARHFDQLKNEYSIIGEIDQIFQEWRGIRAYDDQAQVKVHLDAFIKLHDVEGDPIQSFAHGLIRDYEAVLNGLWLKGNYTSAWVEGNNTKNKCCERVMYGRYKTPYLSLKIRLGSVTYKGVATVQELYRRPAGRAYGPRKTKAA